MRSYPFLQEAIGITVDKFRKKRNLTKLALADFAGIRDSYVRSIIQGKKNPSISVIYSLCEALEVEVPEFLIDVEGERQRLCRKGVAKKESGA